MEQIYNFDQHTPPAFSERMIQDELERRKLQNEILMLVIAGILLQVSFILFGIIMAESYPLFSILCYFYVLMAMNGSVIVAFVYTQKGDLVL